MNLFYRFSITCGLFFILFFSVVVFAIAQQTTPDTDAEYLANKVIDAWSQHDAQLIDDIFAKDGVYIDEPAGRTMHGRSEIKAWLEENFTAVPDFDSKLVTLFSSHDKIALEWVMSGTHTGDYPDLPATGESFSVPGASIALVEDGKIKRWTDYYDIYSFLSQLGVIPGPSEQE